MKKKHLLIGVGVAALLVTSAAAYASNNLGDVINKPKSFNELNENRPQDAASIRLKGNKDNPESSFKKLESIPGVYTDEEAKKKNAHYKLKNLMTYQEAYDKGYTTQFIYEIAGDRMVYVVVSQAETDLDFDGHRIKTPQVTTLYDAETGEKISYELTTADPGSDTVKTAKTAAEMDAPAVDPAAQDSQK